MARWGIPLAEAERRSTDARRRGRVLAGRTRSPARRLVGQPDGAAACRSARGAARKEMGEEDCSLLHGARRMGMGARRTGHGTDTGHGGRAASGGWIRFDGRARNESFLLVKKLKFSLFVIGLTRRGPAKGIESGLRPRPTFFFYSGINPCWNVQWPDAFGP